MIYTVEQAPEIWCSQAQTKCTRADCPGHASDRCIATRCAHWRWFDPASRRNIRPGYEQQPEWQRIGNLPDTGEAEFEIPTQNRRGYCGLSGKPEHTE